VARLKAEADAQHATQRLAVAQQQMAEYASGKAADAQSLAQQSEALDGLLARVLAGLRSAGNGAGDSVDAIGASANAADAAAGSATPAGSEPGPADAGAAALAALGTLRERLAEAANEAAAFAQLQQQGTEAERSKRSSAQVSLEHRGRPVLQYKCPGLRLPFGHGALGQAVHCCSGAAA